MTPPCPRIIVSLPARTVATAVPQIALARDAGADAAEVRVDRFAASDRSALERLFPSALPLVATYRSRAEGGEGEDDPARRRPVLLDLAARPFRWIDLEAARDLAILPELPPSDRIGRIVSRHLPDASDAAWIERLRELEAVDGIGKLVVRAPVGPALREVVPQAARAAENVVLLTTGPSGPLLRAWSRRFAFPFVYAALPDGVAEDPVEPSQVPVDRLRPYLQAEEPPPLFAVCGRPVAHSASPGLHARWMREGGRTGLYVALEFEDDREFLDALEPLAEGGFRGLNVTHPLKAVAFEAADRVEAGARACGTANCLTLDGGEVVAENTDLAAMLRRLEELRAEGRWDGRSLTVVGAGGAARATLAAAREVGARATIHARRPEAARALAQEFGAQVGDRSGAGRSSLLVHATDVGRTAGSALDLDLSALASPGGHVLDWVYRPAADLVRRAATTASATYEDGWRLLVYQAAASYELWWDEPPRAESVARAAAGEP